MEILPEIAQRRSIRQYKSDPVERDVLDRILEAGRLAPSAKNRQEWRFIVVQKKEMLESLKLASFGQEYVAQAPLVIVACTTNVGYRMPNGQLSYPIDLSFSCSFMMMQAVHEGLGTCVVTTFDEQEVKALLSVPYSMHVVMMLTMGFSDEEPGLISRKPLKRIIGWEHW